MQGLKPCNAVTGCILFQKHYRDKSVYRKIKRGKPQYFQRYEIPERKGFNSEEKGAFSQVSALEVSACRARAQLTKAAMTGQGRQQTYAPQISASYAS